MKRIISGILAFTGLALTLLPSVLFFYGAISMQANKVLMATGMLLWFAATPFRIRRAG